MRSVPRISTAVAALVLIAACTGPGGDEHPFGSASPFGGAEYAARCRYEHYSGCYWETVDPPGACIGTGFEWIDDSDNPNHPNCGRSHASWGCPNNPIATNAEDCYYREIEVFCHSY